MICDYCGERYSYIEGTNSKIYYYCPINFGGYCSFDCCLKELIKDGYVKELADGNYLIVEDNETYVKHELLERLGKFVVIDIKEI